MASNIDPTVPITGNPTTQSVRDNFAAAKSEVEALQVADAALEGRVTTNEGNISANSSAIGVNAGNISANSSAIGVNAGNIATNASGIATNTGNISTNIENIATNASGISTNAGNISTNTANIATNTADITTNTGNISTNTANIATNASAIATNAGNISTNTANIATNASAIATNAGNISTNTANIATNTADIAALQGGGSSKWTASGNNIYNSNSGNVGIGTAAPGRKLEVDGGGSGLVAHFTGGTGSNTAGISVGDATTTSDTAVAFRAVGDDALFFAGSSARMRIDDTGVVTGLFTGTGITQNQSKFEVVSAPPGTPDANTIYFVV